MTFDYHVCFDGGIKGAPAAIVFVVKYPNMEKVKGATPASEMFFHQWILVVKSDGELCRCSNTSLTDDGLPKSMTQFKVPL